MTNDATVDKRTVTKTDKSNQFSTKPSTTLPSSQTGVNPTSYAGPKIVVTKGSR